MPPAGAGGAGRPPRGTRPLGGALRGHHPPAIFRQEKLKNDVRLPAARKYIVEHKLNEVFEGQVRDVGVAERLGAIQLGERGRDRGG